MESFYTIIYCQIRAVADEKVSIGLLLRNGPTVVFKYSHDKLKVIKELLPLPAYRLLKANLRNMETFFLNYKDGNPYNLSTNTLFGTMIKETIAVPRYVNSSYIDYLNTYSSNLLTFSKAFPLSANIINDDLYNILYQKFIYDTDELIEHGITIYERVKNKVNPVIEPHVNIDIELTSDQIHDLVVPTHVWFIGENEVRVTGEILDFQKKTYFLENDITKHLNLIHTLQGNRISRGRGTHFLVGKEPSKKQVVNHSIWSNIRKLNLVTYVPIGELGIINDYISKHRVSPFIKKSADINT